MNADVTRTPWDQLGNCLHFAAKYGHSEVVEMLLVHYRKVLELPPLPSLKSAEAGFLDIDDPDKQNLLRNERKFKEFIDDYTPQHTPIMYAVHARDKVSVNSLSLSLSVSLSSSY